MLAPVPVTAAAAAAAAAAARRQCRLSTVPLRRPAPPPAPPPIPALAPAPRLAVTGNAPLETKRICLDAFAHIVGARDRDGFAHAVGKRVRVTHVDVSPRPDEPIRAEARVVCELVVEPDMVNVIGTLHGGCSAFLVDDCSSLPILVLGHELHNKPIHGVTQTLNLCYHAPAFLGAHLRIVSTSLSFGSRIMSSRCEIWDKHNQRLIASGVHTKMQPSPPPSR